MDLKRKANKVILVVNPKKESTNPLEELMQVQSKVLKVKDFVATIIHDKDKHENGQHKTLHLHIYMELAQKTTLKAVLSDFCEKYDLLTEQVEIDLTNNDYLQVQYLTHKNDQDKEQYPLALVQTNDVKLCYEKWNKTYKTEEEIKLEMLESAKKNDFLVLCNTYGVNMVNSLRGLIKEVKSESTSPIKDLEKKILTLETEIEDLKQLANRLINNCTYSLTKKEQNLINLNDLKKCYENIVNFYDNR